MTNLRWLETAFNLFLRFRSSVLLTHRLLDIEGIELGLIPGNLFVELSSSVEHARVLVEPLSPARLLSL